MVEGWEAMLVGDTTSVGSGVGEVMEGTESVGFDMASRSFVFQTASRCVSTTANFCLHVLWKSIEYTQDRFRRD